MLLNLKPLKINLMYLKNFSFTILYFILSLLRLFGVDRNIGFLLSDLYFNKMVLGRDKLATISGKCSQNQEFDISCKCGFDISTFSYSTIRLRIVLKNFSLYYLQPYNYYQSLIN